MTIENSIEESSKNKMGNFWNVKLWLKQQNWFFSIYYSKFLKFLYIVLSSLFVLEYLIYKPAEIHKYLEVTAYVTKFRAF